MLNKGAQVPAALESAIEELAKIVSYIDSHITKGMTTSKVKSHAKKASNNTASAMAELRKAAQSMNEDVEIYSEYIKHTTLK